MIPPALFDRFAPGLFVLIWSTGWIVARFAAPDADPLTFLSLRYVLAGGVLALLAFAMRAPWPRRPREIGHILVTGVLLHAIYLGGVWWAIARGLPAGISALLAAIQPILTAALAPMLVGERISARNWLGIALGFIGMGLVIAPKLAGVAPVALAGVIGPLAINAVAMLSVTAGTFYQKKFVSGGDLRTITAIQYVGAFAVSLPVAMLIEPMRLHWTAHLIGAMAWSVFALSIGAIGLLLMLIRHGAVSRAAALVFLVPPTAAIMAYLMFGETLNRLQIAGMAFTALGVALASRRETQPVAAEPLPAKG